MRLRINAFCQAEVLEGGAVFGKGPLPVDGVARVGGKYVDVMAAVQSVARDRHDSIRAGCQVEKDSRFATEKIEVGIIHFTFDFAGFFSGLASLSGEHLRRGSRHRRLALRGILAASLGFCKRPRIQQKTWTL